VLTSHERSLVRRHAPQPNAPFRPKIQKRVLP
jgi:hypothetical protein